MPFHSVVFRQRMLTLVSNAAGAAANQQSTASASANWQCQQQDVSLVQRHSTASSCCGCLRHTKMIKQCANRGTTSPCLSVAEQISDVVAGPAKQPDHGISKHRCRDSTRTILWKVRACWLRWLHDLNAASCQSLWLPMLPALSRQWNDGVL